MFQRPYTGTTYRHSGSHSRHSIHLRSDDLNNYGRQQRQEYNTGGDSNEKHYYYGYSIQAFRLPFTTQHSPTVERSQQLRTTTTARVQYRGQQQKTLLLWAQRPKATSLHPHGAMDEREESRVLLRTLPRVEVRAVLQHLFFFLLADG